MAWIRLEQNLKSHPKFLKLRTEMGLNEDVILGRLALLWLWSSEYALDGDLRKFSAEVIESACKLPVKTLQSCQFIDVRPYRRIHDWWDYVGSYLKLRFKDHPEKWRRIQTLYEHRSIHHSKGASNPPSNPVDVDLNTLTSKQNKKDVDLNTDVERKSTATSSLALLNSKAGHGKNCTCEICWQKVVR